MIAQERAGLGVVVLVTRLGLLLELVDDDAADDRPDDSRAQVRPASVLTVVTLGLDATRGVGTTAAVAVAAAVHPTTIDAPALLVIAVAGSNLNEIVEDRSLRSGAGHGRLHD